MTVQVPRYHSPLVLFGTEDISENKKIRLGSWAKCFPKNVRSLVDKAAWRFGGD